MNVESFTLGFILGIGLAFIASYLFSSRMRESFASLSLTALRESKADFLQLATAAISGLNEEASAESELRQSKIELLLAPIRESLQRVDEVSRTIEQTRAAAYEGLLTQVQALQHGTNKLATAFGRPQARGSWGEYALQTLCDNAGLIEGQHYVRQHVTSDEDKILKPDMVIQLPRGRVVIIDSKSPLDSYNASLEATDDPTREACLKGHAKAIASHIKALSAKTYWSRYSDSPDCTVMFVPIEAAYVSALETDPTLIEVAANARVILANPMTLISILRAIAHVLDDERLAKGAEEVREQGRKVYEALRACAGHITKVGKHLRQSTDSYNELLTSLDRTVLPRAKRLSELGSASGDPIDLPEPNDSVIRSLENRAEVN